MSLFSRHSDLPGVHGTLRDCTLQGKGLKKLSSGDFAVVDAPNISRQQAQFLIDAKPAVVLNIAKFTTGSIPNHGPHMLLDAGIELVEDMGTAFLTRLRENKKVRLVEDGGVYQGEKLLGEGKIVEKADVEESFAAATRNLSEHAEAYFGNCIQFIQSEAPLLIDGLGIPDFGSKLKGEKVLVVSPSEDHRAQIKLLRNFIREYEPVIIGVGAAADSVYDMGYTPEIVIAHPREVQADTLRSGAQVILPAGPDGQAEGLERIQDLGVGAVTFPSSVDSLTDLALLLADYHQADLIVQVGGALNLDDIFASDKHATPEASLVRMKVGKKLVDADSVISLYTAPAGSSLAWLWAILGILVALATIILIAGFGGDDSFVENLRSVGENLTSIVSGWFS